MDKVLKNYDEAISQLSSRSEELLKRKAQTEARVGEIQAQIPEIQEAIKAAYTNGDDLVELDRRRLQLRSDLELARLGVEGISAELDRIENELSTAIERRNSRFAELAQAWLKKEADTFNSLISKVQDSTRRMFAAKRLIAELGDKTTFMETLGPAGNHLQSLVLLRLMNGFAPVDLTPDKQKAQLRPSGELCESVFGEITR